MLQNILNLNGVTRLSKSEQRSVNGGTGSCCARTFRSCGVNGESLCPSVACDINKATALSLASGPNGGNWCCASCGSASWATIG